MILLKDALDPNRSPTIRLHGRQVRIKVMLEGNVRWLEGNVNVRYLGVYWDTGLRVMSTYSELKPDKARSTEKFNALAAIAKRDWGLDHECLLIRRNIYSGSNVYNDMMVR